MRAFLNFIFALVLLAIATGAWLWRDLESQLDTPLPIVAETRFEVAPGRTLAGALDDLAAQGILDDPRLPLYLRLQARLDGQTAGLKAGEYVFEPGISARQLLDRLIAGRTLLHELLIVEGSAFASALQMLKAHPALKHTLAPAASPAEAMAALGLADLHPEGRFFPDTYRFARGTSDVAVLRLAFDAMQRALDAEWAKRAPDLPYATPDEALVMASIVEKETGAPQERAQIAGVFVRRLQLGMRLQTDPTVIYGMGERFDGNLRRADLLADGEYNSYTRAGLPPTPICLPGRAALHAALHPAPGKTLYFVSRGDGTHEFSETLEQHEAAVRRYQLGQP